MQYQTKILISRIKDSEDNRAKSIVKVDKENLKKTLTINQILGEKENERVFSFLIKIDIEGHEKDLFESNIEWFDKFQIVIIEIHDWMLPGESISKGYLNSIVNSMVENKRDTIIINENLISIKPNDLKYLINKIFSVLSIREKALLFVIFISIFLSGVLEMITISSIIPFLDIMLTPNIIYENFKYKYLVISKELFEKTH